MDGRRILFGPETVVEIRTTSFTKTLLMTNTFIFMT